MDGCGGRRCWSVAGWNDVTHALRVFTNEDLRQIRAREHENVSTMDSIVVIL